MGKCYQLLLFFQTLLAIMFMFMHLADAFLVVVGTPGSWEWIKGPVLRGKWFRVGSVIWVGVGAVSRGFRAGAREEGLGGGLLAGFSGLSGKLKFGWAREQAQVTHSREVFIWH